MNKTIDCFLPCGDSSLILDTIEILKKSENIINIFLLTDNSDIAVPENCRVIIAKNVTSTATMKRIAELAESDYILLNTKYDTILPGYLSMERWIKIAEDSGAGMLYSDSYVESDGVRNPLPVIDYQEGSVRDDFNFGAVMFFNSHVFKMAAQGCDADYKAAGLYDVRLRASRIAPVVHINEYLYTTVALPKTETGEAHFNYVDPKNRDVQIEMEKACTEHLKAIGAWLEPKFEAIDLAEGDFKYEATVIIPVRNRARTIRDAINSVLKQKTSFPFNLIIIDNHSTDGTGEIIEEFTGDSRVKHIIPERSDLGIGGCWNVGVQDEACGRFAVQLDSDDVYSGEDTLEKMVKAFYDNNCAMVVGTYMLTDIDMNMIPPGVIDHKEWTPDNGRNNALRINGLGAPRAFFTPILRKIQVPNTSYGEDYALGLSFSRHYRIGRVYDVVYLCRRWEDNSDHALDIAKTNANNLYKDKLRTWEICARKSMNAGNE